MKRHLLSSLSAFCGILLAGQMLSCNLTDRELGEAPPAPGSDGGAFDTLKAFTRDSVSANLRIFATPQKVRAGHKDKATVTVRVFDDNGNPVRGKLVRFAASLGTITARDTSDGEGLATAVYTPVPFNGEVRVLAAASVTDTLAVVATSVQLEGLTVTVEPASADTLVDRAVPVTVTVTDAEGEPVAAASVTLSGAEAAAGTTDGAGRFRTTVKRGEPGQVKVRAAALGAADSVTVGFWDTPPDSRSRTILLFAEPARIPAANGSESRIRAVVYDDNHNPVPGRAVGFSATHGIITALDTTDADGVAEAAFRGIARNVDATVTAAVTLADTVRKATATVSLAGLRVEIFPAATEASTRDTVALSLRVRDADGMPIPDATVLLSGALQASVRTDASGAASASAASRDERAVTVRASTLGDADSVRIVFLTELPKLSEVLKNGVGKLRIFAENSHLKASNSDQTTVRVIAFDKFNNPLAGRRVSFTANHGIITASDTTDAKGEAVAVYRSVPLNTDARLTATMAVEDSSLSVFTTVTLSGLEVEIRPEQTDALVTRQVPVTLRIVDGAGAPVPDATILFNGNPGVGTTDGNGVFRTSVTSPSKRRVSINASALGDSSSAAVNFWDVLPGPGTGEVNSIRRMRIFSSRSQLRADNSDFASITVLLTDEENNPAVGETVRFATNLGIINETARVDSAGRATATLRSTPINGVARVEAVAVGRNLSAATDVLFSGVNLQLAPDRSEFKVGEQASIEAFLKDASGNPIGGDTAVFTLTGSGAAFDNGEERYTVTLGPTGRALVRVTAATAGTVRIRASALNTADSVALVFSNNTLTLAVQNASIAAGGTASTTLTATYVNGSGAPIAGQTIAFGANAGILSARSAVTDAQGRASVTLTSATFSGTATVQANAATGSAQAKVTFTAGAASRVRLTVTADNIAVNGGVATLQALVLDSLQNTVSGQDVMFRILKGPGGGESITKPLVQSQAGVALTQLQAGSLTSGLRGVLVEASIGSHADTSRLTISGPPHIVTVARPEDDTARVAQGGVINLSVFEQFIGAVVQDVNGNMVADGTEVHFSASVSGMAIARRIFAGWDGLGDSTTSVKPTYASQLFDLPFEDVNDNNAYDPGIDLVLDGLPAVLRRGEDRDGNGTFAWRPDQHAYWKDFNGNGVCDADVGEPAILVEGVEVWADLHLNGARDTSEVLADVDPAPGPQCTMAPGGDFPYHLWEDRAVLPSLEFTDNDFAVAVEVSAVTKNGVAQARVRYPRQLAGRLFVTIFAEANGVRDVNGERFLLDKIVEE